MRKISSAVIACHLFFILALLFQSQRIPMIQNRHVKVRTLQHPSAVTPKFVPQSSQRSSPAKRMVVKKTKPVLRSNNLKHRGMDKEAPSSKPKSKTEQAWNEIDQALAKIEQKGYSERKPAVSLPYIDEDIPSLMVQFLQNTLYLPEVGEVKLELTVTRHGTISKMKVISSESKKNMVYLQHHLLHLQFPFDFEQEKTWTLTFYNEI